MKEYQDILIEYSYSIYSMHSTMIPELEWGNKEVAEKYLEKYWLPKEEYEKAWKPIQDRIFINQEKGLPSLIFAKEYEIIALRGGVLFEEKDFKQLQDCFLKVGDKHFVIVENSFGNELQRTPFRMKYPVAISWQEFMSGNFISSVLAEMCANEYFVFGDSAAWGKYAANDYEKPLDIIGFKKEYSQLFKDIFRVPKEEEFEIFEWLPPLYKKRIYGSRE